MTVYDTRSAPPAQADLPADLRARLKEASLGGPEISRKRHVERGKLLARDGSVAAVDELVEEAAHAH